MGKGKKGHSVNVSIHQAVDHSLIMLLCKLLLSLDYMIEMKILFAVQAPPGCSALKIVDRVQVIYFIGSTSQSSPNIFQLKLE